MIENFSKENIGPCSYDFRLEEIFKHGKIKLVDLEKRKLPKLNQLKLPYFLKPNEYVIGRTLEKLNTPLDLMSFYAMKSTAFRIGLNILYGLNDPGYLGDVIMGIQNVSGNKIKLYRGMKLFQIAFVELKGKPLP
ncbi:hypothetical protein HZC32_03425, partial [Candidatus Woesearchaeota archaeon]|nr:hypothetical protein [Candidatus Woesearchaeota archaeon]